MKEIVGNLWDYHDAGNWAVITTNGTLTYGNWERPLCVMGAGVALQAKKRFPNLPTALGYYVQTSGNIVHAFPQYKLYTFPVKTDWWLKADMDLILRSCEQLSHLAPKDELIFMVRPGCGVGRLAWRDVKPKIEGLLDDRFVVVELPKWEPFT